MSWNKNRNVSKKKQSYRDKRKRKNKKLLKILRQRYKRWRRPKSYCKRKWRSKNKRRKMNASDSNRSR